jgi:hypothetical protein
LGTVMARSARSEEKEGAEVEGGGRGRKGGRGSGGEFLAGKSPTSDGQKMHLRALIHGSRRP